MKFDKKISDIGKSYVYMDLEGMDLPDIDFDTTALRSFNIETYKVLRANAPEEAWEIVFGTSHSFLNSLTIEERQKFANMIIGMHYLILEKMGGNEETLDGHMMKQLESQLSQMLAQFDQEVDLMNRLIVFADEEIPILSFAGVGERAQDTQEMTFYRNDVVQLTAIVLLSKLMAPIFGIFIEQCKKRMDNVLKEMHCVTILRDILKNRCDPLVSKFTYFINRTVKPILNRSKLSHIYNGFTFGVVVQQIYTTLLVRRFISVDLYKPDSNIMKYITSCIRATVTAQFSGSGAASSVTEMTLPSDKSSDEEGNVSILESESKSSSKTADFPLLIKAAMLQLKIRFVVDMELDRDMIDAAEAYYSVNHVSLTPFNSYLFGILFSDYLGGAKSIEMLDGEAINSLVPIMQAYLIQQGYYGLVHSCSITPSGMSKVIPTGSDNILRSTWASSFEYKNCDEKFPYVVNDLRWDTGLKEIVEQLTSNVYKYNTAPAILDALNQESLNGEIYGAPEDLSKNICALINNTLMT